MPSSPTTLAISAAPPNALTLWHDGLSLFLELPGPNNAPYVVRYPLTTSGLQSAMSIIRLQRYDAVDRNHKPYVSAVASPVEFENAQAVLRKLRVIR